MPTPTLPTRIAALLHIVSVMLGFGRHLIETAPQRAASPAFNSIAACFGTGRLQAIMAHLQRGLLLGTALQNVLLARAARGQDIDGAEPRQRAAAASAAPADPPAVPPAEAPAARRPARPAGWDDPELFMPTLKELEAQVRRRPLGCTLVAICLDLAVVPSLCAGPFWNQLHEHIRWYGGSIATLMQEKTRRQEAFSCEQDRKPGSDYAWVDLPREAIRRTLGRFIGEPADAPLGSISEQYAPPAAAAAGPS